MASESRSSSKWYWSPSLVDGLTDRLIGSDEAITGQRSVSSHRERAWAMLAPPEVHIFPALLGF